MAFIPLPFQMVFAAGAAILFRVNLPLSVCLVWITNPVTIPPILLFAYMLGNWIVGDSTVVQPLEFSIEWLRNGGIGSIWRPLVVGCLILSVVSSALGYSLILWIWRWQAIEKWKNRRRHKAHPD
jgi:uncharacterized protein (DUF2062 family)